MCDVNIATGEVTQFEFDVLLSGRIPWRLTRRYSSENPEPGVVGFGWKLNLGTFLRCAPDQIEMVVDGEPSAKFPFIGVGQLRPLDDSGVAVARTDAGISVTDRAGTTFVFPCGDPLPNLTLCVRRYDHYRNFIEYRYDDQGRIQRLIDTFNRHIFFAYDVRSHIVEISMRVAGAGSTQWSLVRYHYDGVDDLVAVTNPNGNATRYEYSSHLLTRVTDPNGRDLCYQYDRNKKCIRTWFSGGVWDRELSHDPVRQRVLMTNPDRYSKLFTHNGKGTITGDVDALGRVLQDVVDQNGRLLLRAGAGGGIPTVIKRDPGSNIVLISRNGLETTTEVDANDQVTMLKNPEGSVWKYEYDAAGNQTRSEAPDGALWRFGYSDTGDLIFSVDPTGYERHRERTADRMTQRDDWGVRWEQRFDYFGRATQVVDGEGGEVSFQYDAAGNPVRRINPDGTSTSVQYDPSGRPTLFTDEFGYQMRLVRDPSETVVKVSRPDGREEAFEYGLMDELKTIRNSKSETAEFRYDPAGRCISVTYFDGRQDVFAYDEADNPTALLDGRTGKILAECRYADDELVEETYYDGRTLRIDYGPSREIASAENSDAALSCERDALRRITTARANGLTLLYGYNLRGDRTSLTSGGGRRIDYEWDGRGRLIRMTDTSSGTYEYSYDARDLCIEIRMPNGCTQHFKYDRRHRMISRRVTRADGSDICSREFSYDAGSRLVSYVDSIRGTRTYAYDSMDLLTSVSDNGAAIRFDHDSNGNLLTTRTGDVAAYSAGDRAVRLGSDELGYDERGNLSLWRSKNGDSRFEYTGEGWLKRALLANGTVAEYEYDPMARRTAKTVDGLRTEFDWDGVHLLGERTAGEAIDYLIMPGSFFLTGLTRGARHYSYVCDQLGTPTELIDEAGEIVWAADFDPHGEVTTVRVDKVAQPFRFLGQYYDDELAWHYNHFRYYSPALGRFLTPDPLCFAAGINLYRYAPNPVNWVDPFGLSFATPAAGRTPATCEVMSKCDWGDDMMEEAKKKTNGVNKGTGCQAIITGPCDRPPDQKDYYMANCVDEEDKAKVEKALKTQNDSCKSQQVDHIKEVQCGGINECKNLTPLTQTVNGSFGSQIKGCRDQLAAQGVTGIVKMKIKLVSIRDADEESLNNHNRKPCEDDDTRCP